MRIGIDAHAIGSRLGGNETYVAGLLSGLERIETPHEFVAYFPSEEAAAPWRGRSGRIEPRVLLAKASVPRLVAELPIRSRKDGLSLLHVQYFAPPACPVPFVPVMHDISFATFPRFFSRKDLLRFRLGIGWTVRRARRVLTISESSKRDIVGRYGVPASRVDVAHLGVDHRQFHPRQDGTTPGASPWGCAWPYVLAVGNVQPRKNLSRLLGAFARARKKSPDLPHRLLLVGKDAFRHREVTARIHALDLDDWVHRTGYVAADQLASLYRGAAVFCYPSLYEGFGLPVVEAMASGTPVIASNNSSIPEVASGSAILVDPEDEESIADALVEVLTSADKRGTLSMLGVERARQFNWEATARAVVASFEAAL